jgi:hypothetical protein
MGKAKIKSKKVEYNNIRFDSETERDFYIHLLNNQEEMGIVEIEPHPRFTLIDPFYIECAFCNGTGKRKNWNTGNLVKCKKCKGEGKKQRQGTAYTADFRVICENGIVRVFDVKGYKNDRFNLIKKLYEFTTGQQLVEVYFKKGQWIFK